MKLTLDEENHIIGVEQQDSNYDYPGVLPIDFKLHKTDGYYMIANQMIVQTPSVEEGKTTVELSDMSQQLSNFAIMIAMNNMKGSGE